MKLYQKFDNKILNIKLGKNRLSQVNRVVNLEEKDNNDESNV